MSARWIARRILLACFGLFTVGTSLHCTGASARSAVTAAVLTLDQQAELRQVQDYLNSIRTLSSRFEQASDNGGVAAGQLYLARPGGMRFEYDPPVPILLIADGRRIHYYDKDLHQLSELDVEDTPMAFLLRDVISLSGDVTVTAFEHRPGAIRLTVAPTGALDRDLVTLVLDDQPLALRQWTMINHQQKAVTLTLTDAHYGTPIDPSLFVWTDPRPAETGVWSTDQ